MSKQSVSMVYRLLEFIKKNTDKDHPATQANLREAAGEELASLYMGDKGTFSRRLRELGDAYNRDEKGQILHKKDWKIVYPGYEKTEESGTKNGKIYYAHEVSDYEMDLILSFVRDTPGLTSDEKKSLEERLVNTLCSKYYKYCDDRDGALIRRLDNECGFKPSDKENEELLNTLRIIREHILSKHMLELTVRGDDNSVDDVQRIRISPYRLIYSDKQFWMIGNIHERPRENSHGNDYTDVLTSVSVDKIESIGTAHTPYETDIYSFMNPVIGPNRHYKRISRARRKTKARNNYIIRRNLEKLDETNDIQLEHMKDI